MLNLREDEKFTTSELDLFAETIIKVKNQRKGADTAISRLVRALNRDKNNISKKNASVKHHYKRQ